jgi:hypothetical protein
MPQTVPDLAVEAHVSTATIAAGFVLGVAAVAPSPLLLARRVRRTDTPSALRGLE